MAGFRMYFKKRHQDLPKDGMRVWKKETVRDDCSVMSGRNRFLR